MGTLGGEGGIWVGTDVERRKRGEQTGLETPVVHALKTMSVDCGIAFSIFRD